jgi:hypothetical protein
MNVRSACSRAAALLAALALLLSALPMPAAAGLVHPAGICRAAAALHPAGDPGRQPAKAPMAAHLCAACVAASVGGVPLPPTPAVAAREGFAPVVYPVGRARLAVRAAAVSHRARAPPAAART